MPADELMKVARENGEHVEPPEVLTTPITPDMAVDPEALEATQVKLLEQAEGIVKVSASVLRDKVDTERLIKRARENNRLSKEAMLAARKRAEEWQAKVKRNK
jgi:hypothetical protein